MKQTGKTAHLMVACGLLSAVAVAVGALISVRELQRQGEAHQLERFLETATVLTATVARLAEQYIDNPERNQIELFNLADAADELAGSQGLTLTGAGSGAPRNFEHIWASSESRYRTADGSLRYDPGRTQILDELSSEVGRIISAVNEDAAAELVELNPQIEQVTRTIIRLLTQDQAADPAELAEMDDVFRVLYRRGSQRLSAVSRRHAGSVPPIEASTLAELGEDVLFYHPIARFDRGNDAWYAGMVRFRRSTQPLHDQQLREHQDNARRTLRNSASVIAVLWGALVLLWALSKPNRWRQADGTE